MRGEWTVTSTRIQRAFSGHSAGIQEDPICIQDNAARIQGIVKAHLAGLHSGEGPLIRLVCIPSGEGPLQ